MTKKSIQISILTFVCAIACSACNESNDSDVIACLANNVCEDPSRVCINGLYCLPKCKADSCDPGYFCADTGICTKEEAEKPVCSDTVPCADKNKQCVNGQCVTPTSSSGTCSGTEKCAKSNTYCVDGACVGASQTKSCTDDAACGEGKYCDDGHCVDQCVSSDGCTNYRVCDTAVGKCIEKCYLNGCPAGQACNNDGLCVVGECTSWQRCYESGFDRTYVCDVPNFKCIKVCSAGTCGDGKYCDAEDGLCHEGECSEVDACTGSKVCDLSKHVCVEKCTSDASCNGLLCDVDGRCVEPCSVGTCGSGKACDPASLLCIEAECSAIDGCSLNYQVCDAGKCVDKCTMSGVTCGEGTVCDKNSGLCIPRCTKGGCAQGEVCGNEGKCVTGECSLIEECKDTAKVCSANYKCVTPKEVNNDCYFYSTCETFCDGTREEECEKCRAKSKWCPEGQQCNAYNTCIDSASADGLGLGMACDDAVEGKKCASDLYCDPKQNVCLQAAYKVQGTSCTAGAYTDHCEGNLIVECSDYYSQVMVYDCKTHYINWDLGTTGAFYGDDYVCAKRPGTNYVACAQQCSSAEVASGATKHVCGWDLDDNDIEYSDKYVCEYNEEGISAYFNEDSEECWYGCSYDNGGICDRY